METKVSPKGEKNLVSLHRYPRAKRMFFRVFGKHLPFPVVYDDGLISSRAADLEKVFDDDSKSQIGTPWGIVFKGWIIKLTEPSEKLNQELAEHYCAKISFAGKRAELPPFELLEEIRTSLHKVNPFLEEVGGKKFHSGIYRSSTAGRDQSKFVLHMNLFPDSIYYTMRPASEGHVRPVIKL